MAATGYAAGGRQPTIQDAIGALKAKLGGGRQAVRGLPSGGMMAGPDGRLPVNSAPPLALSGTPSGVRTGAPAVGAEPMPFRGGPPPAAGWGGGGAPAGPSPFDRDAAATGMWRGAARFGKPATEVPWAVNDGAGPGPVPSGPPIASFPPQGGGGMQSLPADVGLNQLTGGAPPPGPVSPVLQAALAKQQQLKGGFGALLQGALQPRLGGA